MASLTPKLTSRSPGINYATDPLPASAGGDNWANNGQQTFWIRNGGGSPITLTLVFPPSAAVDGVQPANRTASIAAAGEMEFGPFAPSVYNDTAGNMSVTYSAVTAVVVLVKQNGKA